MADVGEVDKMQLQSRSCLTGDISVTSLHKLLSHQFFENQISMAGIKHPRSEDEPAETAEPASTSSPFISMFEIFRSELDEHHDRRERIIKASRDITALSKKM